MTDRLLRPVKSVVPINVRPRKRRRVYVRKNEEVLAAAAELFLKHGYGETSMDAVAQRAKVTKATVYSNFSSKEELFSAVIKQSHVRRMAVAYVELDENTDVRAALIKFANTFLGHIYSREAIELVRTVIAEAFRFPKLAKMMTEGPFTQVRGQLAAYFERRVAAGEFRNLNPESMAAHFAGMLKADNQLLLFLNQKVDVSPKAIQKSVETSVDLFLDGARVHRMDRAKPRHQ